MDNSTPRLTTYSLCYEHRLTPPTPWLRNETERSQNNKQIQGNQVSGKEKQVSPFSLVLD